MLILTRRVNERIVIDTSDGQIVVAPLGVSGSQIKIGVDAPRNVAVNREEIAQAKKENPNANKSR